MNWNELALKYTQETLEFIKAGKDGVVTQGTLYVQELIKLEIYLGILGIIGGIIFLTVAYFCFKKLKNTGGIADRPDIVIPFGAAFLISFILGICILGDNVQQVVKATVAPRVLIIEKLSNVIKCDKK